MLYVTEAIANSVIQHAIRETARKLGRDEDIEWAFDDELIEWIRGQNPDLYSKLEQFLSLYIKWFKQIKQWEDLGKLDNLDSEEKHAYKTLAIDRNSSREQLIEALRILVSVHAIKDGTGSFRT